MGEGKTDRWDIIDEINSAEREVAELRYFEADMRAQRLARRLQLGLQLGMTAKMGPEPGAVIDPDLLDPGVRASMLAALPPATCGKTGNAHPLDRSAACIRRRGHHGGCSSTQRDDPGDVHARASIAPSTARGAAALAEKLGVRGLGEDYFAVNVAQTRPCEIGCACFGCLVALEAAGSGWARQQLAEWAARHSSGPTAGASAAFWIDNNRNEGTMTTNADRLHTQLAGCLTAATGGSGSFVPPDAYGWSPALEATQRLRRAAEGLAAILDDIDSASDRARGDVDAYRALVAAQVAKARRIVSADGAGVVRWHDIDGMEWGEPSPAFAVVAGLSVEEVAQAIGCPVAWVAPAPALADFQRWTITAPGAAAPRVTFELSGMQLAVAAADLRQGWLTTNPDVQAAIREVRRLLGM